MKSYLLLIRLYKLRCCNKVLISLYDGLGMTDVEGKNICIERSAKRRKIKAELEDRISKVRNQKGLSLENTLFYLSSIGLDAISQILLYFQSEKWNNIVKWEMRNLHLYYEALYTPETPKPVVDMLLRQKKDIESCEIKTYN